MLVDEQNTDKNPPGVPGAPSIYESQHIILISSVETTHQWDLLPP